MSAKLNQIIAIEKGVKSRVYGDLTELHKASQRADLFSGLSKVYEKVNEGDEDLPAESKKVQLTYKDVFGKTETLLTELFDVTASKDYANCDALADVVLAGTTLIEGAPVSYLLFLEKQLTDVRTMIDKLPVLDPADDWSQDVNSGLFKTSESKTHRTKKIPRPIVMYPATVEHPAQTQMVADDIIAGYWKTVKQSGAIPASVKQTTLDKVERLLEAVKFAREAANSVDAPEQKIGQRIFGYLFG